MSALPLSLAGSLFPNYKHTHEAEAGGSGRSTWAWERLATRKLLSSCRRRLLWGLSTCSGRWLQQDVALAGLGLDPGPPHLTVMGILPGGVQAMGPPGAGLRVWGWWTLGAAQAAVCRPGAVAVGGRPCVSYPLPSE